MIYSHYYYYFDFNNYNLKTGDNCYFNSHFLFVLVTNKGKEIKPRVYFTARVKSDGRKRCLGKCCPGGHL